MAKKKKEIIDLVNKILESDLVVHDSVFGLSKGKGIELSETEYRLIEPYYLGHYNLVFTPYKSKREESWFGGAFGSTVTVHNMDGKIEKVYLDFYDGMRERFGMVMGLMNAF